MLSEKVTAMERAIGSYLSPGKYSAHRKLESQYVTTTAFICDILSRLWTGHRPRFDATAGSGAEALWPLRSSSFREKKLHLKAELWQGKLNGPRPAQGSRSLCRSPE